MAKLERNHSNKKTGFEAPERYFDELPSRIQKGIQQSKHPEEAWWSMAQWRLALAPALLIALGFIGYLQWHDAPLSGEVLASQSQAIEEVDYDAIVDYLVEDEDLHQSELYELATEVYASDEEDALEDAFLEEVDVHELDEYL